MEPKMRLFFCVLCLSTTCLGASAARAQTSSEWIIARMGGALRPDVTWEQVRSNMLMAFYQSNPDERGVTPQGIDNLRRSVMAQRRAQAIAQILNYGLDGDGSVSKDEITAVMQPRARQMIHVNGVQLEPTPQQVRLQLEKLISDALKPDTDGDGIITPAETYVTTVEVAPGRDPLYLALASNSAMIWDIVGATERVVGVIAHSETTLENTSDRAERQRVAGINPAEPQPGGKPLVGVMGLPREKVHFTAHKG